VHKHPTEPPAPKGGAFLRRTVFSDGLKQTGAGRTNRTKPIHLVLQRIREPFPWSSGEATPLWQRKIIARALPPHTWKAIWNTV